MPSSEHLPRTRTQRSLMVCEQLVKRGIRDQRVLDAMGNVPRELFLPTSLVPRAYEDRALAIGCNQTISQPYMVALTLEALCLEPSHRVLEIGTGSGYQTALLADLVRQVISVEVVSELARSARERLRACGCENITVVEGDGSVGHPASAPYDRIAVSAGSPVIPPSLLDQLDEGGILVIPVGERRQQSLVKVVRRRGEFFEENLCSCVFVPLVGVEGWREGGGQTV